MRGDRSKGKPNLKVKECFYAVHPLSMQFERDSTHSYLLYFQKDLHIMGRYDIPDRTILKDQRFYFGLPASIQNFKAVSPEELQFNWSLYIYRVSDNYKQEEFMQSKKANLRWCWEVLEKHEQKVSTIQASFGTARLKINYLFILQPSPDLIVPSIEQYYRQNGVIPTAKQPLYTPIEESLVLFSKTHSIADPNAHTSYHTDSEQFNSQSLMNGSPYKYETYGSSRFKPQEETPRAFSYHQAEDDKGSKPRKLDKAQIRHSISKAEVSKDIERQIRAKQIKNQLSSSQPREGVSPTQLFEPQLGVEPESYSQVKQITSSQFLNQRGDLVITPLYQHPKYWLVSLAILFIFIWLIGQGPKQRRVSKSRSRHPKAAHEGKGVKRKKGGAKQDEGGRSLGKGMKGRAASKGRRGK